MLLLQTALYETSRAFEREGISIVNKIPIMAITTISSMRVKEDFLLNNIGFHTNKLTIA